MNDPLVSILMPTYRRPHYLRQSLASALQQSYQNIEVIVRDNASKDETPVVVSSFGDARVTFLQSEATVDPFENGMECLRRATGKFCMTLADDDFIAPNYVATLARALSDDQIAMAYSGGVLINAEGEIIGKSGPKGSYCMESMDFLAGWNDGTLPFVTPASMFMRTEWLKTIAGELGEARFPEGHNSDNALMIWMALRGKVFFTDATSYSYRIHPGSTFMRMSSAACLKGDKALIKFVNEQKRGGHAGRLSKSQWKEFQGRLLDVISFSYVNRTVKYRLNAPYSTSFADLTFRPAKVFGWLTVKRALCMHKEEIKPFFPLLAKGLWLLEPKALLNAMRVRFALGTKLKNLRVRLTGALRQHCSR